MTRLARLIANIFRKDFYNLYFMIEYTIYESWEYIFFTAAKTNHLQIYILCYVFVNPTTVHLLQSFIEFTICSFSIQAIHNWHGNVRHGLELDVGDSVEILEECGPWLRGTCPRKPRSVGLFPRSYIHTKDVSKSDPIVQECTQVLREWSETWKKLFVVSICLSVFIIFIS